MPSGRNRGTQIWGTTESSSVCKMSGLLTSEPVCACRPQVDSWVWVGPARLSRKNRLSRNVWNAYSIRMLRVFRIFRSEALLQLFNLWNCKVELSHPRYSAGMWQCVLVPINIDLRQAADQKLSIDTSPIANKSLERPRARWGFLVGTCWDPKPQLHYIESAHRTISELKSDRFQI